MKTFRNFIFAIVLGYLFCTIFIGTPESFSQFYVKYLTNPVNYPFFIVVGFLIFKECQNNKIP